MTLQRTPGHRVNLGTNEATKDVTTISVSKTLREPAGSFTVELTRGAAEYARKIASNDTVSIQLCADTGTEPYSTVLLGLVDRVGEFLEVSRDGTPHAGFRVNGRCLGKLLVEHDLFIDPASAGILDNGVALNVEWFEGAPHEVVGRLFQKHFLEKQAARQQLAYPLADRFGGVTRNLGGLAGLGGATGAVPGLGGLLGGAGVTDPLSAVGLEQARRLLADPAFAGTGTLASQIQPDFQSARGRKAEFAVLSENMWSLLLRNADQPWNELYTITEPDGRYVLRMRPAPFSQSGAVQGVTFHDITHEHVITRDLGLSDHERVNFLMVYPVLTIFDTSALRVALGAIEFDMGSIMQNGLRPQQLTTPYCVDSTEAEIQWRTKLAWGWFRRNHEYHTGSLRIAGRPRVVVGEGVRYDGRTYYVEGVTHSYHIGQPYTTSLQLTRGQ